MAFRSEHRMFAFTLTRAVVFDGVPVDIVLPCVCDTTVITATGWAIDGRFIGRVQCRTCGSSIEMELK